MDVLSSVDVEGLLVCFVCDAVPNPASKHHLAASHKIIHDVFEGWLESYRIYQIKVNSIRGCYLNSLISFYKVNRALHINLPIIEPTALLGELIQLQFEK